MARVTPKIPISAGTGGPTLKFADEEWAGIEAAFGFSIIEGDRTKIIEVTCDYLAGAMLELGAAPVSMAIDRIQEVKSAAATLQTAIMKPIPADQKLKSADFYARQLIAGRLRSHPTGASEKLRSLALDARAVARACNDALRYLNQASPEDGFRKGEAWDSWIRQLTATCKSSGLPFKVRKDTDRHNGSPSAFVTFVEQLQKRIPGEFRRLIQSPDALAVAIVKARRAPRFGSLKTPHRSSNKTRTNQD